MMTKLKVILLTLIYILTISWCSGDNPYCALTNCPDKHTMCIYDDNLAKACKSPSEMHIGLTQEERKLILDEHNKYRSDVATGKTKFPKASNMMKMHWDKELEHIAQRWALQCDFSHDTCRNTLDGKAVGQNAAMQPMPRAANDRQGTLKEAIKGLYDEEKFMDPATDIDVFPGLQKGNDVVGHFTQVVWAKSERLGCGYVDYPEGEHYAYVNLFCNYAESGNFLGEPLYQRGEPCSACPKGTSCSKVYDGLCTAGEFDNKEVPDTDDQDEDNPNKKKRGSGKGGSERDVVTPALLGLIWVAAVMWLIND